METKAPLLYFNSETFLRYLFFVIFNTVYKFCILLYTYVNGHGKMKLNLKTFSINGFIEKHKTIFQSETYPLFTSIYLNFLYRD